MPKTRLRSAWSLVAALVLAIGLTATPAMAQSSSGSNPTAEAVSEEQLLQELDRITGRVSIPDAKAATLQQPEGRDFRGYHEGALPWIGGLAIIGMLVVLAIFFLWRGRVRTQAPESGIKILRFNVFERLTHWVTAVSFIVLGITGLNFVFGKRVLMPIIGADAFATWSFWAKYAHDFTSWAFMLGVIAMLLIWIIDNIPDRYDGPWLRAGGGMFDKSNHTHPPARRFNAGQKLMFWAVILSGAALSVSGIFLLFPFEFAGIAGMQLAQVVHATVAVLMVAVILAHIYIGTLGMEGAWPAMGSGEVDLTWAKEHHSVWVERQQAKTASGRQPLPPGAHATPAE
jgi:formate dehydrogenase subunit gamma